MHTPLYVLAAQAIASHKPIRGKAFEVPTTKGYRSARATDLKAGDRVRICSSDYTLAELPAVLRGKVALQLLGLKRPMVLDRDAELLVAPVQTKR